ncbi:MAG: hypothetical protein D6809_00085, partial [Gammaproteobacteria bacterium]
MGLRVDLVAWRRPLLVLLAAAGLAACATGPRGLEREAERVLPPLEVPPGLDLPAREAATALPELPGPPGPVAVERDGARRWLVVQAPPGRVWPLVEAFWRGQGWEPAWEDRGKGLMLTAWRQARPPAKGQGPEDQAWAGGVR